MPIINYPDSEWMTVSCGCKTNGADWKSCDVHIVPLIRTSDELEFIRLQKKYNDLLAACYVLTKVHLRDDSLVHRASPEWIYNGVSESEYGNAWDTIRLALQGSEPFETPYCMGYKTGYVTAKVHNEVLLENAFNHFWDAWYGEYRGHATPEQVAAIIKDCKDVFKIEFRESL